MGKNKNNKDKNNYHIFRVEEVKDRILPKKITMVRIHAEDDNDAYLQLKDYIKAANKQYTYYVEKYIPISTIRNGKKYTYSDSFEMWEDDKNFEKWYVRIWDKICIECRHWFITKPKDVYYWCRDFIYLNKHKQQYYASWCIDTILLDTLLFNIPILKKYKHCYSWKMLEKAYLEKNPKNTKEDAKKFIHSQYNGFGEDIEKRAIELEKQMFDQLTDDIKAYKYYLGDYMYIDKNDKELVETDKKLRHTLPLIKGSYDRYDYNKLNLLVEKYWNRIWETVRKYGQEFND